MNKLALSIALTLLSCAATAQTSNSSSGSTSGARSGDSSANLVLIQEASAIPSDTKSAANVRYDYGRQDVRTTGSVFMPGNAVASGGFNCGATGSAGVGVLGASVGVSGAKSLEACVFMNLMNFAIQANDPEFYKAAICSFTEGKAVMTELDFKCPSQRRAEAAGVRPVAAGNTGFQQSYGAR